MDITQFTTLRFGTVEIYSDWSGSSVRICRPDGSRLQWTTPDTHTDTPLEQGRSAWTRDEKISLSERLLRRATDELETSYPGGYTAAVNDVRHWLLHERPCSTGGMMCRKYTTLIFGDVEIHSDSTGSFLRISRDRSRTTAEYPGAQTDTSLDDGRLEWSREMKVDLSELFLQRAEATLESTYPGGYRSAVDHFRDWLLSATR
ncbi:hypothetical protein [Corynebacterium kalidii]|uniref:Uncharacterized protein n=1 Tax=Corynebacterium kalidii TaxID=2931982 RepID=A0A9X2B2I8_9CORY|nr:hypothetical protein [Corynebacterium kalidii]MCJ7858795.1 hypothetical protein [Corynebacterium kalidii]